MLNILTKVFEMVTLLIHFTSAKMLSGNRFEVTKLCFKTWCTNCSFIVFTLKIAVSKNIYSRVHKSWNSFFSKILEKPSIVQKKMLPHIKAWVFLRESVSTNVWRENKIQHELVFGPTRPAHLQCGRNSNFCMSKG